MEDPQLLLTHDITAEPDTAGTDDAALSVEDNMGAKRHLLWLVDLLLDEPTLARAVIVGILLQDTLASLIADGAIQGVVDQDELQHAFAGLFDLWGVGGNYHAIG